VAHESGDVVVIMGREVVVYEDFGTPYDGQRVHRRFTNAFRMIDGAWCQILRHASTVRVEDGDGLRVDPPREDGRPCNL
jgi:hypothetical protein